MGILDRAARAVERMEAAYSRLVGVWAVVDCFADTRLYRFASEAEAREWVARYRPGDGFELVDREGARRRGFGPADFARCGHGDVAPGVRLYAWRSKNLY